MKKSVVYIALLGILLFSSCKKWQLTKDTQEGADTFSCITDGQVFKPCTGILSFGGPQLSGGVSSYPAGIPMAFVYAQCNEHNPQKRMVIELKYYHGEGNYPLADTNNVLQYIEYYPSKSFTSKGGSGSVTITKDDRYHHILSGTFEGTLVDLFSPGHSIKVKNGRFDVNTN